MDQVWRNWEELSEAEQQEVRALYGYMGQAVLERLAWRRNSDERVNHPRIGRSMARWSGERKMQNAECKMQNAK